MNVGIFLFPEIEALDFAGPFEVFTTCSRVARRLQPDASDARQVLAWLIVADQFPRNLYRGEAQAFATDAQALAACHAALAARLDIRLPPVARWFVYLPLEHAEDLALQVIKEVGVEGELSFHTDPCHRVYCAMCDLGECPVRREPFRARQPLTLEEAVQPDMPRPAGVGAPP